MIHNFKVLSAAHLTKRQALHIVHSEKEAFFAMRRIRIRTRGKSNNLLIIMEPLQFCSEDL